MCEAIVAMKAGKYLLHFFLLALLATKAAAHLPQSTANANQKSYIVYMGDRLDDGASTSLLHANMLQDAFGGESKSVLCSYKKSFNGFVVDLNEEEAQKMAGMDGVVSVFPNEKRKLHTTKSWDFMGFPQQVERAAMESDVIIGVFDTGIWPESQSFDDKGISPPPTKWKGSCQVEPSDNFTCNNKIIGAKYYHSDGMFFPSDLVSPRDSDGHGTHTASTAAGNSVDGFSTLVRLGDNTSYEGISINTFDLKNKTYPIIYGRDAPNTTAGYTGRSSRFCTINSLDRDSVKGKIVLCDTIESGRGPFLAGAAGMVTRNEDWTDYTDLFPLPTSSFNLVDGGMIYQYINLTSTPNATIFKSDEVSDTLAPYVVSFSSRGPNPITPDIIKPDISAPGVYILAAWSPISPVSQLEVDNRFEGFNIISGTSMSCPHVSGAAAYVKSFHPTWSPAAIQSALMTTASPMSPGINLEAEFAYGSGHLNPLQAANPGLVYDANEADYITFLCRQGYATRFLQLLTKDNSTTCLGSTNGTVSDLNYPSFGLSTSPSKAFSRSFKRTVTNVGSPLALYRADLSFPNGGLNVRVVPDVLVFTSVGQKLSFDVVIEGTLDESLVSGSLVWDDGEHKVRSPIVVFI
ncbi:hypothetical protein V6N11_013948 [Hibiscus sabdariffa]|uniref:Cucumisin n=2 Tax=Hibiscus sabdariffa TaxID=183260 RepID=A0ABR2A2K5_9ROSI